VLSPALLLLLLLLLLLCQVSCINHGMLSFCLSLSLCVFVLSFFISPAAHSFVDDHAEQTCVAFPQCTPVSSSVAASAGPTLSNVVCNVSGVAYNYVDDLFCTFAANCVR
jgi:hypothetical protein